MVSIHPSFAGRASVDAYFGNEMIIVLFFSLQVDQFGNNYWSPYLLASILPWPHLCPQMIFQKFKYDYVFLLYKTLIYLLSP